MDYNENFYKILELDKNASETDIKKNYRKLSKKHHPDVNKEGSDDEFKKISSAYEILSDKNKKSEYDRMSPYGKNYDPSARFQNIFSGFDPFGGGGFDPFGGPGGTIDPFEFMRNIFNNRREEFIENLDIQININVGLKDVYNNENIKIQYDHFVVCGECSFTGFDHNSESFPCEACDGKGGDGFTRCKYCNGTGKIFTGTCKKCNGNKVILKKEEFNITNSFRINESATRYFRSYGHHSKYYQNKIGTLIININYVDDPKYKRMGNNLIYKLNLHFQKAIDGYIYEHQHIDGKKYSVKIPPKTNDGDLLKMKDRGLMISDSQRGDLIFDINIVIDYNELEKNE